MPVDGTQLAPTYTSSGYQDTYKLLFARCYGHSRLCQKRVRLAQIP